VISLTTYPFTMLPRQVFIPSLFHSAAFRSISLGFFFHHRKSHSNFYNFFLALFSTGMGSFITHPLDHLARVYAERHTLDFLTKPRAFVSETLGTRGGILGLFRGLGKTRIFMPAITLLTYSNFTQNHPPEVLTDKK